MSRCSAGDDAGEEHAPEQRELDVQRPWDGSARPGGGWKEDQSGTAERGGAEKGLVEGSAGLSSWGLVWGLGSYGQLLLNRLGCGQACFSDKTFLAAARVRARGRGGVREAGEEWERRRPDLVVEAKKDGFREPPCTERVTLR